MQRSRMYRCVLGAIAPSVFALFLALPATPAQADSLFNIRIALDAPPRLRRERRPERPSREHTWIKGYYHRQENQWVWIEGRWERPRDRHAHWVKARYRRDDGAWRYEPGRWSYETVQEGDDYREWREQRESRRQERRDRERDERNRDRRRN